jgi:hypothetical protein
MLLSAGLLVVKIVVKLVVKRFRSTFACRSSECSLCTVHASGKASSKAISQVLVAAIG